MPPSAEPQPPMIDSSSFEFECSLAGFRCVPDIHGRVEATINFVAASATLVEALVSNVVERGTDAVRSLGSFASRITYRIK